MSIVSLTENDNVISNTVKIADLEAVRELVDEYELDVDIQSKPIKDSPGGWLRIRGLRWPLWPRAVMIDDLPFSAANDDTELYAAMEDHGTEGFTDFLLELAEYIESPLVIQAVLLDRNEFLQAQEWVVYPGASKVHTTLIEVLADDGDQNAKDLNDAGDVAWQSIGAEVNEARIEESVESR